MRRETRSTCYGRWSSSTPLSFAGTAERAEGRILDCGFVVIRKSKFNEAVEIFENFGITLHRCLPVLVDTTFQLSLGSRNLIRMRRCVIIMIGMSCHAFQVFGMRRLASFRQQAEILEDIILGMSPHP